MARRKSENRQEADKKGAARMKRYEENLEKTVDPASLAEDERIIKYYGKYGDDDWQEYEYVYKIKKK
jgi:hypothetical protein